MITLVQPSSPEELEAYYHARWLLLRAPLGFEKGTEKDNQEHESTHLMAVDGGNRVVGVVRAHLKEATVGQIRYMAVDESLRGTGVGRQLVSRIEELMKVQGVTTIVLNAREGAVPFYKKCGYEIYEKGDILLGSVQHWWMKRQL